MSETPNVNLFPLESAENGVSQAVRSLCEIEPIDETQVELRKMCVEDLKEVQDGSLLALRRAIENG